MMKIITTLNQLIRQSGAQVGFAAHNLATGQEILIQPDLSFHPASTFKVCVMMEAFHQARQGLFSLDDAILVKNEFTSIVAGGSPYSLYAKDDSETDLYQHIGGPLAIREIIFRMITASSNLATNLLIERVTPERTTQFMRELGTNDVIVRRGVEDNQAFRLGLNNAATARGLMQTLLKLACPGVPDIYQGQELWDFSLVDPDNRRPVDFALRNRLLDCLHGQEPRSNGDFAKELLENLGDGRCKLWLTERLLNFRRKRRALFREGNYIPLQAEGSRQEHVVAFARSYAGEFIIVAAPRLAYTLMRGSEHPPINAVWNDTAVLLPPSFPGPMRNLFTGEPVNPRNENRLLCSDLFAHLPFALLTG